MATPSGPTLYQALAVARRLPRHERAQLITALVQELADQTEVAPDPIRSERITVTNESWEGLFRVLDEIAALPRSGPLSLTEELSQSRR